jgi:hypothetical protein
VKGLQSPALGITFLEHGDIVTRPTGGEARGEVTTEPLTRRRVQPIMMAA